MRKILFAVVCLLLCGTARAQNYVPIVSGVATVDASQGTNAQTSSFLIILTANVTSLEIIKPKTGQQITIILQQDSTGGRTVSCAADVLNCVTVTSTASAVTSQAFAYNTNTNTWSGLSATTGGTSTGVSAVTGTSPIVSSGGATPAISCPTCFTGTAAVSSVFTRSGAVTAANGDYTASQVTGAVGPVFNALNYGAVGDGSTANAAAFAALATAVNAYVQHPTDAQGLTDLPVAYLPSGTYNYASGLNFTQPMIIKCDQGAVLNYTGSAHAIDWGPTNLTGSTYQTTYYEIGCTFKGGASMTEGIYVNDGVLWPRIWDSRFVNFGNSTSTVWEIFFNGISVGVDDAEVARNFFIIDDNVARNGIKMNSPNAVVTNPMRIHDNTALCAQVPGTTNANGTHSCSTTATFLFSDGAASQIQHNNIQWYQPNIQLGSNSFGTIIDGLIGETNSSVSSVSSPMISFGDSTGGNNVSANISGVMVSNIQINTHNTDYSTTSPIIGPTTTSALLSNWNISHIRGSEVSASIPIVSLNNTVGQTGNSFLDVLSAVSGTSFTAATLINTTGTNLTTPFVGLTTDGVAGGTPVYGIACSNSTISATACTWRVHAYGAMGAVVSRIILDTAADSNTFPTRGGLIQHTSGAGGGTKIGDWEGLPVQVLTNPTGVSGNIALNTVFLPQGGTADEGTTFGASGCSISAHSGGAATGQYTSGTSGTCTVSITPGSTAPHGWSCDAHDITTPADVQGQTAASTTTIPVISGTTVSGDVVNFKCVAY